MPPTVIPTSKKALRKNRAKSLRRGVALGSQVGMASGKKVSFRHPAAFGEAARKYAGIVSSGVGNLSTREGFDG